MVLLCINKLTDNFCLQVANTESVDDVSRKAGLIHNTRLRVNRLVGGVRDLVKHGPEKPEKEHGLTEEQINAGGDAMKKVPHADPLGKRVGKPCDPTVGKVLEKCCLEAEAAVAEELAKRRTPIDMEKVSECIQNIKGAVMMAYPMGLPAWDPVRLELEGNDNLAGMADSKHVVDPETCVLWFAGKQLMRDQVLSKYTGRNDKCILKAKLEPKGTGAPQREPAIDEETRKAMVARWHKKQEVEKALAEDDDDAFANSSWANPKAWKNDIAGVGGIRFR
jgi:hypothetical protein